MKTITIVRFISTFFMVGLILHASSHAKTKTTNLEPEKVVAVKSAVKTKYSAKSVAAASSSKFYESSPLNSTSKSASRLAKSKAAAPKSEVASLDRNLVSGGRLTFATNRQQEARDPNIVLANPPIVRNEKMFLQINTQWMKGVDMTRHRVTIRVKLDGSEEPEFSQMMIPLGTDPLLGSDFGALLMVGNSMPGMPGLRSGRTYRFRIVVEDIMSGSIVASLDHDPESGRPLTFTTY